MTMTLLGDIARCGVRTSFGSCGSQNTQFARAVPRLSLLDVLDEHLAKNPCAGIVVGIVIFHEAPSINVNDIAFAFGSQKIKPTDGLSESCAYPGCHGRFILGKLGDKSDFFSVLIPADQSIDDGRLPGLCMAVFRTNGVCFHVLGVIDIHELLVDITALHSRLTEIGVELRAFVADLAEKSTTALASSKIDINVVVFAIRRLLHIGLLQSLAINIQRIAIFTQFDLLGYLPFALLRDLHASSRFQLRSEFWLHIRATIARDDKAARSGNLDSIKDLEDKTSVPEDLLELKIVDAIRLPKTHIGDGFVQRKPS